MAVTGNGYQPKKYNYQPLQNNTPAGQQVSTDPQQARGVSDQTRAQQAKYQNGYQPSENVTQAQGRLNQVLAQKPAGYTSKYGAALDGILQEIQNPEKFQYSFNNDEMFKYYADLYNQQGRQASADAMGQAAGLTGGYGNSYAAGVGNQAFQQYLLNLYDRGMDFRNAARQEFEADRADRYNRLGALQDADQTDYGRYRDEVGDWETERGYYTDRADTEYDRDYDAFLQDRNYWDTQAQRENADFWQAMGYNEEMRQNDAARQLQYDTLNTENEYKYNTLEENQNEFAAQYEQAMREFEENQRQFDTNMAEEIRQFNETSKMDWAKLQEDQRQFDANLSEEQRQYNKNQAWGYIQAIIAQNQIPSNELLVAAGLSLEDAQKMIMQIVETGGWDEGGSGGGGSGGGGNNGVNNDKAKGGHLVSAKRISYTGKNGIQTVYGGKYDTPENRPSSNKTSTSAQAATNAPKNLSEAFNNAVAQPQESIKKKAGFNSTK